MIQSHLTGKIFYISKQQKAPTNQAVKTEWYSRILNSGKAFYLFSNSYVQNFILSGHMESMIPDNGKCRIACCNIRTTGNKIT